MQCRNHPEKSAANTCNQCGSWLCDECIVDIQGRLFCRGCLVEVSSSHGAAPPPKAIGGRRISWGLLFFFSCFFPPGTNYMYMGLIKRGLVAMCGFFLLIYLVTVSGRLLTPLFAFAIPVFVLTCIFDSFSIRRRMNLGELIPDGVGDIINTLLRNKTATFIILGILLITLAGSVLGFAFEVLARAIPLLIVGCILYVIFIRKSRK